jgi:hypothetical protein
MISKAEAEAQAELDAALAAIENEAEDEMFTAALAKKAEMDAIENARLDRLEAEMDGRWIVEETSPKTERITV